MLALALALADWHGAGLPSRMAQGTLTIVGQEGLLRPLDGSAAEHINTVWQRVTLAGVAIPTSKHYGLNASIQLRQSHLRRQVIVRQGLRVCNLGLGTEV